jgi:hypothetical protein
MPAAFCFDGFAWLFFWPGRAGNTGHHVMATRPGTCYRSPMNMKRVLARVGSLAILFALIGFVTYHPTAFVGTPQSEPASVTNGERWRAMCQIEVTGRSKADLQDCVDRHAIAALAAKMNADREQALQALR